MTRGGKHNTSNNNLNSLIGTTPTSSSPKPRSPSGFPIRSPPTTNANNNNNFNSKSPRQNSLYTPAQAASSVSTPNMQQKQHNNNNNNWAAPRRSNSYHTKALQANNPQPSQRTDGKEEGEGFMLFAPDEESSPPTEPLPDTFSPYAARRNENSNNLANNSNNNNNILHTNNNNGNTAKSLPDVPDTT